VDTRWARIRADLRTGCGVLIENMARMLLSLMRKVKRKRTDTPPVIDVEPGSPEWEAICRRCGECCFELVYDEDDILISSTMCEFLDPETRMCRVYETRFEVCHDCIKLTGDNLPRFDWLPDTCGYVMRFRLRGGRKGK
jgi:hypothetical protein